MTAQPTILPEVREVRGILTVNLGAVVLVASTSEPGEWHTVLSGRQCSCKGFAFSGRCKHLGIASEAVELDRLTAQLEPLPAPSRNLTRRGVVRCMWATMDRGRCHERATVTMQYADQHGSHNSEYCAEHAELVRAAGWVEVPWFDEGRGE